MLLGKALHAGPCFFSPKSCFRVPPNLHFEALVQAGAPFSVFSPGRRQAQKRRPKSLLLVPFGLHGSPSGIFLFPLGDQWQPISSDMISTGHSSTLWQPGPSFWVIPPPLGRRRGTHFGGLLQEGVQMERLLNESQQPGTFAQGRCQSPGLPALSPRPKDKLIP